MQGDFSGKHMCMHTITLTKQASGVILSGLICFFLIPRNHLFSYRTNIPPSWTCNMYRMWSELWPVLCAMPAFLIGLWGFDCWALDQRDAVKNTMSLPSFTWNILKRANLIQLGITTYQCRSIPFNTHDQNAVFCLWLRYYKGYDVRKKFPNIDRWLAAYEELPHYMASKSDYYTHCSLFCIKDNVPCSHLYS